MLRVAVMCTIISLISTLAHAQGYTINLDGQKFCIFNSEVFSVGAIICPTRLMLLACSRDGTWVDAKSSPDPAACPRPSAFFSNDYGKEGPAQ
jgi:hypothetical protein